MSRVYPKSTAPAQVLADALLMGPTLGAGSIFSNASSNTTTTVCPDGFQANSIKRIAGGGYLLCMRSVKWPVPPTVPVITDVAVVTGPAKRGWNSLKCPNKYTKVPFIDEAGGGPFDDGIPRVPDNATRLSALCLRSEDAKARGKRAPVVGLRTVASKAECAALGKAWQLVANDLSAAWPGSKQTLLCMTKTAF